eukprot:jgi/Ulvmu1/11479/UM077_0023.1
MAEVLVPPFEQFCGAVQTAGSHALHSVRHVRGQVKNSLQHASKVVEQVLSPLNLKVHGSLARISQPGLASMCARQLPFHGPAIGDLGMVRPEIMKKLSTIPVFTVTNDEQELVIISGEKDKDGSQSKMVHFYFSKKDAEELVERIRQENKGLGDKAHVYPMTVDHVYDYLTQEPASARDVSFILVPNPREVKSALKLYDGANQTINSFRGVPVFQAEDLSIDIENQKLTPVFLSKADLDVALRDADATRKQEQAERYTRDAKKHREDYDAAKKEVALASDEKARETAKAKAEAAQSLEAQALEMKKKIKKAALPQVEVACLEDVILQMERDPSDRWAEAFFVPPGSLAATK